MRVAALWRYPVKSLQGERVEVTGVDRRGLAGDRHWALLDPTTGFTLTARRVPELLFASAALDDELGVRITLADGSTPASDADLGDWLGRPAQLVTAGQRGGLYESPLDPEHEDGEWRRWRGPGGAFHDSARTKVSVVSTGSLDGWDERRFRSNVVIEATAQEEVGLVGAEVAVGSARLDVVKRIDRCVVVTRAQPGIERDLDVFRCLAREHETCIGVAATVAVPGTIAVGDELRTG
jgi:uncharacterized protein YcbX